MDSVNSIRHAECSLLGHTVCDLSRITGQTNKLNFKTLAFSIHRIVLCFL